MLPDPEDGVDRGADACTCVLSVGTLLEQVVVRRLCVADVGDHREANGVFVEGLRVARFADATAVLAACMLDELLSKQQETVEAVQGYVEGLGDTVLDAESSLWEATEEIRELVPSACAGDDERKILAAMLQRKFKVGYGRAARIVDQLQTVGVIGPAEGKSTVREVVG